jgi:hypothetical protein
MVKTFYFEFFFHVNDKKDVDVKCPQNMSCIICYSNLVFFLNFKTQAKKRSNHTQYNKWNNNIEKSCECKLFYYCKNI